jgi:hypothetical protein
MLSHAINANGYVAVRVVISCYHVMECYNVYMILWLAIRG